MGKLKYTYNLLVVLIADKFAEKYYKDCFNEIENIEDIDYDLMDYQWIPHMIEICDEYYSIEDMLFTLDLDINCKDLSKRYQGSMENIIEENLYNYYLTNIKWK